MAGLERKAGSTVIRIPGIVTPRELFSSVDVLKENPPFGEAADFRKLKIALLGGFTQLTHLFEAGGIISEDGSEIITLTHDFEKFPSTSYKHAQIPYDFKYKLGYTLGPEKNREANPAFFIQDINGKALAHSSIKAACVSHMKLQFKEKQVLSPLIHPESAVNQLLMAVSRKYGVGQIDKRGKKYIGNTPIFKSPSHKS